MPLPEECYGPGAWGRSRDPVFIEDSEKGEVVMKVRLLAAALAAMMMNLATGAPSGASGPDTRIFTDSAGREVEVPATIDSAAPSGPLAQILLYSLAPGKLSGLAVDFPAEARGYVDERHWNLPCFGQFYGKNANLNMEALIAASPRVIVDVGEPKPTIREDMDALQKQLGIPVVFIQSSLDSLPEAYVMLGGLLGEAERAELLAAAGRRILDHAASVRSAIGSGGEVRVYSAMGKAGLNTNARDSFHAQALDRAGALNVADIPPDSRGAGSTVSLEQVLLWNPQVILAETGEIRRRILEDPAWSGIEAVRNGRVYRIPDVPYSFVSNPPSANRLLGILWLGHLLYPEHYRSDLKEDVVEFFRLFYSINLSDAQYEEVMKDAL